MTRLPSGTPAAYSNSPLRRKIPKKMKLLKKSFSSGIIFVMRRFTHPGPMLLILLLLSWNTIFLQAQTGTGTANYLLSNQAIQLSDKDGLSQNTITCMLQDNRGFMWFGTQDGLNRYDGYRFKTYRHDPDNTSSLPGNYIMTIFSSPRYPDILWIGTDDELCTYRFETETFRSARNDPDFLPFLSGTGVTFILESPNGELWFATGGEGLFHYLPDSGKWTRYKDKPGHSPIFDSNSLFGLSMDKWGNLWIGSLSGGLSRWDKQTRRISRVHLNISQPGKPPGKLPYNCLLCENGDRLLLGTDGAGLLALDIPENPGSTLTPAPFTETSRATGAAGAGNVNVLHRDSGGRTWSVGNGGGLFLSEPGSDGRRRFPVFYQGRDILPEIQLMSLVEDRGGSIWLGSLTQGIYKISPRFRQFRRYPPRPSNGLRHKEIWDMEACAREPGFWIGTSGGLYRFSPGEERFFYIPHTDKAANDLNHRRILSLCEDRRGDLWLGTDGGGVYRRRKHTETFVHYPPQPGKPGGLTSGRIYCIYEDRQGDLWFGIEVGGLCRLTAGKRGAEDFTRYFPDEGDPGSLPNASVNVLVEDAEGNLWMGTDGAGICRFNRDKENFKGFTVEGGPPEVLRWSSVLTIYPDSEGLLWVGAYTGLTRLDTGSGTWKHFTVKDGLPNNMIYGILEEPPAVPGKGGNLWISSNKGLSCFIRSRGRFKNYDRGDGLPGNEFNSLSYARGAGGLMLFGGVNGLSAFYPAKIKDNPHIPPVYFTGFQLHYKTVPIKPGGGTPLSRSITHTGEIRLNYRQHTFSFEFAALEYANPAKNSYAYMLEGFDSGWITLPERRPVNYTNVPPGDYTFRVRASNNNGAWNNTGAAVRMTIRSSFLSTLWFKVLAVSLMAVLLLLLHRTRTHRITQKLEKQRLEKELKLKADFTAMLVHDLRSPLTAIMGYSGLMEDTPGKIDTRRTGAMITRNSEHMMQIIDDMLDISKFEAGKMELSRKKTTLTGITEDCISMMKPLFERKEISLRRVPAEEMRDRKLDMDGQKIGEVITNLLSNAIKFSPPKGSIILGSEITGDGHCEFRVTDNGPGIREEKQVYLFDKYAQLKMEKKEKGTGLGLAFSRLIIEAHGGTIGYRPGPMGKGSTFFFRLPLEPRDQAKQNSIPEG